MEGSRLNNSTTTRMSRSRPMRRSPEAGLARWLNVCAMGSKRNKNLPKKCQSINQVWRGGEAQRSDTRRRYQCHSILLFLPSFFFTFFMYIHIISTAFVHVYRTRATFTHWISIFLSNKEASDVTRGLRRVFRYRSAFSRELFKSRRDRRRSGKREKSWRKTRAAALDTALRRSPRASYRHDIPPRSQLRGIP